MKRLAAAILCLAVLCTAINASAGDSRTVVIANRTLATISVIRNGVFTSERFIPPGSFIVLTDYLTMGRNELQFLTPFADPANAAGKAVWVSGENADRTELTLRDSDFGMTAIMDRPGAGVDPGNEDHARCMEHAGVAMEQLAKAQGMGCELGGDMWVEDYQEHFQWCVGVDYESPRAAQSARAEALLDCEERKAHEEYCRQYASTAQEQYDTAKGLGCDYDGGIWVDGWNAHYDWCLGANKEAADAGTSARELGLNACREKMARKGYCEKYAATAVEQFNTSKLMGCDYGEPRWGDNKKGHFDWCMGATDEAVASETKAREEGLLQCAERQKQKQQN